MQSKELLEKMAQAAVKYGDRDLRRRGHLIDTYMNKTLTDEEIVDAAIWLAFPLDIPLDEWTRINNTLITEE